MKTLINTLAIAALSLGILAGPANAFYAGVGAPHPISAELGVGDVDGERDCLVPDPVGVVFNNEAGIEENCLAETSPSANPFRIAGNTIDATYNLLTDWAR